MALSITVNGGGTFSASMEEGPVSFTATLGAVPGPKGDTGATGPTGVIAATAPILYDSGTQTVSIDPDPTFNSVTTNQLTVNNGGNVISINGIEIIFQDATTQTTAFVGEARKEYVIARNNTGSTIAAGKVVYLSGATGNKPTIALALADSEATSARTIGITVESIANNADGKVVISGAAENIDTSAFSAGDTLYLSATTAGAMTTTLPAAPLHGVVIGIVTRANPSVGSIEVAINNYQELKELSDVSVADRANNDGLFWEASSSTWRSKTIAEVLGLTPIALTSLSASAPISYNSGTGAFTFDSSGFLLKADNLSGLASASTARTNLGLGSAALSSTSDFAAAVHTHTASAITDFSTAVDAVVPAASTTTAGKVELATEAEAIAGTSATLAVTPSTLDIVASSPARLAIGGAVFSSGTSGTGASFAANTGTNQRQVSAPTTATGYATGVYSFLARPKVSYNSAIDWSKRNEFDFLLIKGVNTSDANTVGRVVIGKPSFASVAGDPTTRTVGVRFYGNGNLQLIVHDGTSLTATSTSISMTSTAFLVLRIVSEGNGTVRLFSDGTEVATTTSGPTVSTGSSNAMYMEAQNLATISTQGMQFLVGNFTATFGY